MTVAVTGASGVVGSSIVQKLMSENINTRCIVRDVGSPGLLQEIKKPVEIVEADVLDMAGLVKALEGVDAIVHAAGFVSFNPRNKRKLLDINVQGTRNVVNACLAQGTKKLIHISSVAALGRHRAGSFVNEESKWVPGMPVSDYAQSKYLSELEVFRGMEEGLSVSVVNPSVVLSAGDGRRSSSLLFGYVWRQRRLFTDFVLNYVDARDVSQIVTKLLRGEFNGERFVASGGTVSARNIFSEVARRFQKQAPSIAVPFTLANIASWVEEFRSTITGSEPIISRQSMRALREGLIFENTKARRILGMEFQSLENTLDWCCDAYQTVIQTNKNSKLAPK